MGPLTLLAQLYNVTLSARFSMTIAACSVTRIAMSEVSVGWEAATIGHRSGGDFSVNGAPFDSVWGSAAVGATALAEGTK